MSASHLDASVIICSYTEDRFVDLVEAIRSVQRQSHPVRQILVVVDGNPALERRAAARFPSVMVIPSVGGPGLSRARNTGIAAAEGAIVAFLDDDAIAEADWLEQLLAGYADPRVAAVGGAIEPWWARRPEWFPEEFDWVVGCTYRGMPASEMPVRNLIGCNMSFRREVCRLVGGFRADMGRLGTRPLGCEETEFCIRLRQRLPEARIIYRPQARVRHRVPSQRAQWRYFRARCYAEGQSKALVARAAGPQAALATERAYVLRTLPAGVLAGLAAAGHGDWAGLARAGAIVTGLALTSGGYLSARLAGAVQ